MSALIVGILLGFAQMLSTVFLCLAVFSPGYHKQTLIIPGGNGLGFDLSLFSVICTSDCLPFFVNAPFFNSVDKLKFSAICRGLVAQLHNKSLLEVKNFLCGINVAFYGLPGTGCTAFGSIYIGSILLLWFLAISILVSLSALTFIVRFFAFQPTIATRKTIVGLQMASAGVACCGTLVYILFGGTISSTMLAGGLFGSHEVHSLHWSFGAGLIVLFVSLVWSLTMPMWTFWAIKLKYCSNYMNSHRLQAEETQALLYQIGTETKKPFSYVARHPQLH